MIESLKALDLSFFIFLNSLHVEFLNAFMVFWSGQVVWIVFIFYVIWLAKKKLGNRTTFVFVLFLILTVIATDVTSSYVLKNAFSRLRPCRDLHVKPLIYYFGQKCGGKFGFVSSHAANSFAILTFSIKALNLKKHHHLLWILPVLVGYSRIYLGVHYPGDILAGSLVGISWGLILTSFFRDYIMGPNGSAPKSSS